MKDLHGRDYAKLSKLGVGDKIELDAGFTCHCKGTTYVRLDKHRQLYFLCDEAHHILSGQADNGEDLIGIYHA